MSLEHVAGHADDVVLDDLEIFAIRERLCDSSIYSLMCRILKRIGFLCESLDSFNVLCSDLCVFTSIYDLSAVSLLSDRELRHADDSLIDLDAKRFLRIFDEEGKGTAGMDAVIHSAVLDSGRMCLLVVYDLFVVSIDLGYSKSHLGCSQVNRNNMFLVRFHSILELFFLLRF